MKGHLLKTQMALPMKLIEVFPFFCDAVNLERITPSKLHFQITTPRPIKITLGTVVNYMLQLHTIQFKWRSEITVWRPPYMSSSMSKFRDHFAFGFTSTSSMKKRGYDYSGHSSIPITPVASGRNSFSFAQPTSLDVYLHIDSKLHRLSC